MATIGRGVVILILALASRSSVLLAAPPAQTGSTYVVQPGDTLLALGLFYGIPAVELAALNPDAALRPPGAGDALQVPGASDDETSVEEVGETPPRPDSYTVQRGDTLFRIATRFGLTTAALVEFNGIAAPDRIFAGQVLALPDSDYAPTVTSNTGDAPAPTVSEGKQIVVVLSQQRVYAFEDGILLRQFVASTGLPATPTVTGSFAIYQKLTSQRMTGPGYDLPGVPWVMYFYRGYALHGTYWHNNFGAPMSHGCVNLRTAEAEWLYEWAPIETPVLVIN